MLKNTPNSRLDYFPANVLHAYNDVYDPEWFNSYESSAFFDIARGKANEPLPHCLLLSVVPGVLSDLFTVKEPSKMMITVCVFKDDYSLAKFVETSNGCIVSAISGSGVELV